MFSGGEGAQITPMQGGGQKGESISQILSASPIPTQAILSAPVEAQPSIIGAAASAAGTVIKQTGDVEKAATAGLTAAVAQAALKQNQPVLSKTPISDSDNKLLLTARPGPEQDAAAQAASAASQQSIATGEPVAVSNQKGTDASISDIKDYRQTHPYDDPTMTFEISKADASAILNTKDPAEKKVGEDAYQSAYASALAAGKNSADAKEIATIAQVRAIQEYRAPTKDVPQPKTIANPPKKPNAIATKIQSIANDTIYLEYNAAESTLNSGYMGILSKRESEATIGKHFEEEMKARMTAYQTKQQALWVSSLSTVILPRPNTFKALKQNEILVAFSRMVYILPVSTTDIVVLPPMNGSSKLFMQCLQTLDSMGILKIEPNGSMLIKDGVVVVCTAPFYNANPVPEQVHMNFVLLSLALDIKEKNRTRWFVLSESTSEQYSVGSTFHAARKVPTSEPLINMMEPSYILYPYVRKGLEGILISSRQPSEDVSLPADASKKVTLSSIYKHKNYGKALVRNYKPDIHKEAASEYFVVHGGSEPMKVPDVQIADCGLANYSLPEMLPTLHPSKHITLSSATVGHPPKKVSVILSFRLQIDSVYEPLCLAEKTDGSHLMKFIASPEATTDPSKIQTAPYEAAGQFFQIRRSNRRDRVYAEWQKGLYTEDEAKFLNTLNLAPDMMDQIFPQVVDAAGNVVGLPWKDWVANFLSNITTDHSLMTHREKMISRNFLERVYEYFAARGLRKDMEESDSDDIVQRQHGLIEPDEVDSIQKDTFPDIKREWGTLEVYGNEERDEYITSVILVNKTTFKQMYRTVGVPMKEYTLDQAKDALKKKIEDLKKKYTQWIFIY
jgi:hypothetical protein